jgi:hypothetical protein
MQTEVEAGNAPELGTVTPTGQEQAQTPVEISAEPGTGQTADAVETPPQDKRNADAIQRRIDQLTREKYEERRHREAIQARLQQYEQQGQETPQQEPVDLDAAVEARIKQREFEKKTDSVYQAGKAEFPDFDKSLETFKLFGGIPPAMSDVVLEIDDAHKVLNHLGSNPAEVERLMSMSAPRMALEIGRIEASLKQIKPPPISKAPAPISPIGGKSAPVEPAEFGSTEEYAAWRRKTR